MTTSDARSYAWINRSIDEPSLRFVIIVAGCIGAGAGGLIGAFLTASGDPNVARDVLRLGLFAVPSVFFITAACAFFPSIAGPVLNIGEGTRWCTLEPGQKALIRQNGRFTGEVAESGFLLVPPTYGWKVFDCSLKSITTREIAVSSRDGYAISAVNRVQIQLTDLFAFMKYGELPVSLQEITTSALHDAVASSNAADLILHRAAIVEKTREALQRTLSTYGYKLEFLSVDFQKLPDVIRSMTATAARLKNQFPSFSDEKIIEIVMNYDGTRSHATKILGLDSATLELIKKLFDGPGSK